MSLIHTYPSPCLNFSNRDLKIYTYLKRRLWPCLLRGIVVAIRHRLMVRYGARMPRVYGLSPTTDLLIRSRDLFIDDIRSVAAYTCQFPATSRQNPRTLLVLVRGAGPSRKHLLPPVPSRTLYKDNYLYFFLLYRACNTA